MLCFSVWLKIFIIHVTHKRTFSHIETHTDTHVNIKYTLVNFSGPLCISDLKYKNFVICVHLDRTAIDNIDEDGDDDDDDQSNDDDNNRIFLNLRKPFGLSQ